VKFGVHLNAQTSFDETIINLQMPSDRLRNQKLEISGAWVPKKENNG
jgi:predicted Zn-dependent peptidase